LNLQAAEQKNEADGDLLRPLHVEFKHTRDRDRQDAKVAEHIDYAHT
jgi:hypothetical protein